MSPQSQPENDITGKMSQYMHEHLLIEILLDMRNKNIYPEKELYEETVKLVEDRTEKILLLQDLTNKDYSDRNRDACRDLDNLSTKVANLLTIMEEGKIQELLTKSNTFQDLLQLGNISREEINNLYYWSKAQFNYGFYAKSILGMTVYSEILKKIVLLELEREGGVPDEPRYSLLNLKWGLLAAHILEKNWEHASLVALQIEEYLEFCSTNAPSTSSLNSLLGIMQGNTSAVTVAGGPNGLQFSMSPFGVQGNLQVMLSKKEILQQRCWLFHWTLFILFKGQSGLNQQINQQATTAAEDPTSTVEGNNGETNSAETVAAPATICSLVNPKMWDRLLDTFVSEAYLALISLQAPHLLRYVAALYIREKRLKSLTKDLIHVLSQDKENYSDSLTEFLLALHQDLDFDTAKTKLIESQTLINNDYFLSGVYDSTNNSQVTIRDPASGITTVHVAKPTVPSYSNLETIMNNARLSIFQIYCRTHQSVDINTIADKMGLPSEICEEYIVSLIQAGKLSGACIDYKENSGSNSNSESSDASVFFPKNKTDVSTQVLEKTKNMSFRLFLLQANATTTQQMKKDQTKIGNLSAELAKHLN